MSSEKIRVKDPDNPFTQWQALGGSQIFKTPWVKSWMKPDRLAKIYPYLHEKQVRRKFSLVGFLAFLGIIYLIGVTGAYIYRNNVYPSITGRLWKFDHPDSPQFQLKGGNSSVVGVNFDPTPVPIITTKQDPTPAPQQVIVVVQYPTPIPTQAPTPQDGSPTGQVLYLLYSYYDPTIGGINCADFQNGQCLSKMANGLDWRSYYGKALACPSWIPLGTKLRVTDFPPINGEWVCMDRGSALEDPVLVDGVQYWFVDFLTHSQDLAWRTIVPMEVVK
jgi:hypothetical protein